MFMQIDLTSPVPAYEQIVRQVQSGIVSGRFKHGDRIPSIRDLAVELRLNRNTVARSFLEMERQGLIRTRVGLGSHVQVKHSDEESREWIEQTLIDDAQLLIERAADLGVSGPDLCDILKQYFKKK